MIDTDLLFYTSLFGNTTAIAKPEWLYPEAMSSCGFFLSGVPGERFLLVGVEIKPPSRLSTMARLLWFCSKAERAGPRDLTA
jgi:hypothetical protein